ATWTFEGEAGTRFEMRIKTALVDRSATPTESWQDLSPLTVTGKPRWPTTLAEQADRLPLYLRHPARAYWFTYVPESGMLYFQFNRAEEDEAGPSFDAFGDTLIAVGRGAPIRSLVVDLRFNSGGNLQVARDFMVRLAREPWAGQPGRLFVIVGRCTFSAGLY